MARRDDECFMGFSCLRCGQCVQDEDEQDAECPHGPVFDEDNPRPCNYSESLIWEHPDTGEWIDADHMDEEDEDVDDD